MKKIGKTAEAHDFTFNQHQPAGDSPKNSAKLSAHGRAKFTKSYERDGDNMTADGAPVAAGEKGTYFKGKK